MRERERVRERETVCSQPRRFSHHSPRARLRVEKVNDYSTDSSKKEEIVLALGM